LVLFVLALLSIGPQPERNSPRSGNPEEDSRMQTVRRQSITGPTRNVGIFLIQPMLPARLLAHRLCQSYQTPSSRPCEIFLGRSRAWRQIRCFRDGLGEKLFRSSARCPGEGFPSSTSPCDLQPIITTPREHIQQFHQFRPGVLFEKPCSWSPARTCPSNCGAGARITENQRCNWRG